MIFSLLLMIASVHSRVYRQFAYFGGLFNTYENNSILADVQDSIERKAAFLMAVNDINNHADNVYDNLLLNTVIRTSVAASQESNFFNAVSAAYNTYLNSDALLDAVIGPDGEEAMADTMDFTQSIGKLQMAFASGTTVMDDKSTFPQTVRVSHAESAEAAIVGVRIIDQIFNWKRVVLIGTTDNYGSRMLNNFQTMAASLTSIKILGISTFSPIHRTFDSVIKKAKTYDGYIFVIFAPPPVTGRFLEAGYNAGLFKEGTQIIGGSFLQDPGTLQAIKNKANIPYIMKGVLSVAPYFFYNDSVTGRDFVKRWRAQTATRTVLPNGSILCSNATDSFGTYLHRGSVTSSCQGLDFASYRPDGADLDMYAGYTYDATIAVAKAMDNLIYAQKKNEFTYTDLVKALEANVSFTGVTGRVSFSGGVDEDMNGAGERLTGLRFRVSNFDPSRYLADPTVSAFVPVLQSTIDGATRVCRGCVPFMYNTADNSIPSDSPTEILVRFPVSAQVGIDALSIICIFFILRYYLLFFSYRKTKIIKRSQPQIHWLILFGGIIGVVEISLSGSGALSDSMCVAQLWMPHLAFGLVISCLIVKCWVVNKIFNSGLKRIRIKLHDAFVNIFLCMIVFVFFLFLVTFVGKPHQSIFIYRPTLDVQPRRFKFCYQEVPFVGTLLKVLEILALLLAARMAIVIRHVPSGVNETREVLAVVTVITLLGLVDTGLGNLSNLDKTAVVAVTRFMFAFGVLLTSIILYEPKSYYLHWGYEFDADLKLIHKDTAVSQTSTLTDSGKGNNPEYLKVMPVDSLLIAIASNETKVNKRLCRYQIILINEEIAALERHVLEWKEVSTMLKKDKLEDYILRNNLDNVYINPNYTDRASST